MPKRIHRVLTWHPTLERYTGLMADGRMLTVGWQTVEAVYKEAFHWWWDPGQRTRHHQCDQFAWKRALSVNTYLAAVKLKRPYRSRYATWDLWTCHPANIPPLVSAVLVVDVLQAA